LRIVQRFAVVGFAALAGVVGLLAYLASSKPYEARASLLVVNPYSSNPYLGVGRGQYAAAEVVQAKILSDATIARLSATGSMSRFTLELDQGISEPVLDIKATGPNASLVVSTRNQLIAAAKRELAVSQRNIGAAPSSLLEFQQIDATVGAELIRHNAIQNGVEACAGAYLVLLLGASARRSYNEQRRADALPPGSNGDVVQSPPNPNVSEPAADRLLTMRLVLRTKPGCAPEPRSGT
jgi:hypothetical protein